MVAKTPAAKKREANAKLKRDAKNKDDLGAILRNPKSTPIQKAKAESQIKRDRLKQANATSEVHYWSASIGRAITALKVGRPASFETPEELLTAAQDYFKYCEKNPNFEQKAFSTQEGVVDHAMEKIVPFTLHGFYAFVGIGATTFEQYAKNDEFKGIVELIRSVISGQKITLALQGFINATLTQRIEGISDRIESTAEVSYTPIDFNDMYNDPSEDES